ncbi:histone-lysine N-methyltransferase ASHR1 isoform X3 [Cucumis melo var. makuwa]|uniref:Histone-lysine N-methyltransferase ASHR1 isoform X3 n=1 Tax=Cucumis melo var. makuwa TaxID=1194695 RepID=A0A5D3D550_CUCMM|nr:histone-lysine N-methyltransferase ASHR1 isoform X3 [Cucumis melo var. makuwa]
MVKKRIEHLELIDQEIAEMKKKLSKMPVIESSLSDIAKNLKLMPLQSEKQQQSLMMMMESSAKECLVMSYQIDQSIGDVRNEKKIDSKENSSDRNKIKKVEMPVFTDEDPDLWLFHAESAEVAFCRSKGLAKMMQVAQLVENREIIRGEVNMSGFSGGKYPIQTIANNKSGVIYMVGENKGNTVFPMRTITLRSTNPNENRKEGSCKRLPDYEFQEEYEIVEEDETERKKLNRLEIKENFSPYVELSINSV